MRKFLVVMLFLAIAGGAFAEDAEDAVTSWSNFSVEGGVRTNVNFWNGESGYVGGYPGISGTAFDGPKLTLTWDYSKGNWAINLPLRFEVGYTGVHDDPNGTITYSNGGATVKTEFNFKFAAVDGLIPVTWGWANITGEYAGDNYAIKIGLKDILTGGTKGVMGGTFKLLSNEALELVVSHNGAYETSWWNASGISRGSIRWGNEDGLTENWWTDVEGNGLAIRYHITDAINAGVAFAGKAGDAMFSGFSSAATESELIENSRRRYHLFDEFLQPTFGAQFGLGDMLDATLALGLRSAYTVGNTGSLVDSNGLGIATSIGAKFTVPLDGIDLSIQGDVTFGIPSPKLSTFDSNAQFYAGAQVNFGMDTIPLAASLRFALRGTDSKDLLWTPLGDTPEWTPVPMLGVWLGFNRTLTGDRNFDWDDFNGAGDGIWAAAFINLKNLGQEQNLFDMEARLGYNGLAIGEKLTFGAAVEMLFTQNILNNWYDRKARTEYEEKYADFLKANPDTKVVERPLAEDYERRAVNRFQLVVAPELAFTVNSNAKITLGYKFGSSDLTAISAEYKGFAGYMYEKRGMDINELTLSFKWNF